VNLLAGSNYDNRVLSINLSNSNFVFFISARTALISAISAPSSISIWQYRSISAKNLALVRARHSTGSQGFRPEYGCCLARHCVGASAPVRIRDGKHLRTHSRHINGLAGHFQETTGWPLPFWRRFFRRAGAHPVKWPARCYCTAAPRNSRPGQGAGDHAGMDVSI